ALLRWRNWPNLGWVAILRSALQEGAPRWAGFQPLREARQQVRSAGSLVGLLFLGLFLRLLRRPSTPQLWLPLAAAEPLPQGQGLPLEH
ncbi:unnamed protein product, partial [Prorocentrum cordatum]